MENGCMTGLVADLDFKEQLYSQDLVILMATESNYQSFPYGFIESFFEKCLPNFLETKRIKLEKMIEKIKSDPTWYQYVAEKATMKGRSIDNQIKSDAQFMIDQEEKK
jgi:hypothetical protein